MAAALIMVFSPDEIASRLDDRFRLLSGGSRTALERHQTLRALMGIMLKVAVFSARRLPASKSFLRWKEMRLIKELRFKQEP